MLNHSPEYSLCRSLPNQLIEIRALSEVEYQEFIRDIKSVNQISYLMNPYLLFKLAFDDFIDWKNQYYKLVADRVSYHNANQKRIYLEVNYKICTVLSFFRQFLDQCANLLSDEYGKESEVYKLFDRETSLIFDSEFSYRFGYKLRNYALHRYIPIKSFTITYENIDSKEIYNAEPFIETKELLKEKDLWGKNWEELSTLSSDINAFDLLEKIHKHTLRLHSLVFNFTVQQNRESIIRIASYISQFPEIEGDLVLKKMVFGKEKNPKLNLLLIPEKLIRDLIILDRVN